MVKQAASSVTFSVPAGCSPRCRIWMVSEGDQLAKTPDGERLRFLSIHGDDRSKEVWGERLPICALRLHRGQLYLEERQPGLGVLTVVGLLAAAVVYVCDERNAQASDWQRQRVLEFPGLMSRLVQGDYQVARGLASW